MCNGRSVILEVRADMVASVLTVYADPGATVEIGDTLLLLESMKMEIPVIAEHAGQVREVRVEPGFVVQEGDVLVTLESR